MFDVYFQDLEEADPEEGEGANEDEDEEDLPVGPGADEFVCGLCFLVAHRSREVAGACADCTT